MNFKRHDTSQIKETGNKVRQAPARWSLLLMVLILASFAALLVACGDDSSATPAAIDTASSVQPTAAAAPEPTAAPMTGPTPEPVDITSPETTAASVPEPTAVPVATATPEPTATPTLEPSPVPAPTATPNPTAAPTSMPTPEPTPEPTPATMFPVATEAPRDMPVAIGLNNDDLTKAYVASAIAFYEENGLEATQEHYKSSASVQNGRTLILLDEAESRLLIYRSIPALEGQYVGPGSSFSGLGMLIQVATEEGYWTVTRGINPVTKQEEPRRVLIVLHDGLVFSASHSVLVEDVADSVIEYVNRAIAKYDGEGLDSVITHYNSLDSLDGQFYLFLIGADDNYLAHPIFPHLIGSDIKDVVGSGGHELGKEIAQATEEGLWVEYLWPHPVSRKEQQKVTWAIRHDGLIFASGYYSGDPETGPPAWRDADPIDYTVQYVNQAIERYERDGLESMLNYYNSVASFEGEWYLFATDDDDIYHVHPLLPGLLGTDIKDVRGSDGYALGEELAKATEEGIWVEYLWPNPVTLKEVPKVSYAVRRDGMLFASGYYLRFDDPAGRTVEYVQGAIDYYRNNGLDATVARYNSPDSLDGQWGLTLADQADILRVAPLARHLIGTDLKDLSTQRGREIGQEMADSTAEGTWISYVFPNIRSSETLYAHTWGVRYDGILFMSRFYSDQPDLQSAP